MSGGGGGDSVGGLFRTLFRKRDPLSISSLTELVRDFAAAERSKRRSVRKCTALFRSIVEVVLHSDQQDETRCFDVFTRADLLSRFVRLLRSTTDVEQLQEQLQLLELLVYNVSSSGALNYILSNQWFMEMLGQGVSLIQSLGPAAEELYAQFAALLRAVSSKATEDTIQFFMRPDLNSVPVLTSAGQLLTLSDRLVRIAARTCILRIVQVHHPLVSDIVYRACQSLFQAIVRQLRELCMRLQYVHEQKRSASLRESVANDARESLQFISDLLCASSDAVAGVLSANLLAMLDDVVLPPLFGNENAHLQLPTALMVLANVFSCVRHRSTLLALVRALLGPLPAPAVPPLAPHAAGADGTALLASSSSSRLDASAAPGATGSRAVSAPGEAGWEEAITVRIDVVPAPRSASSSLSGTGVAPSASGGPASPWAASSAALHDACAVELTISVAPLAFRTNGLACIRSFVHSPDVVVRKCVCALLDSIARNYIVPRHELVARGALLDSKPPSQSDAGRGARGGAAEHPAGGVASQPATPARGAPFAVIGTPMAASVSVSAATKPAVATPARGTSASSRSAERSGAASVSSESEGAASAPADGSGAARAAHEPAAHNGFPANGARDEAADASAAAPETLVDDVLAQLLLPLDLCDQPAWQLALSALLQMVDAVSLPSRLRSEVERAYEEAERGVRALLSTPRADSAASALDCFAHVPLPEMERAISDGTVLDGDDPPDFIAAIQHIHQTDDVIEASRTVLRFMCLRQLAAVVLDRVATAYPRTKRHVVGEAYNDDNAHYVIDVPCKHQRQNARLIVNISLGEVLVVNVFPGVQSPASAGGVHASAPPLLRVAWVGALSLLEVAVDIYFVHVHCGIVSVGVDLVEIEAARRVCKLLADARQRWLRELSGRMLDMVSQSTSPQGEPLVTDSLRGSFGRVTHVRQKSASSHPLDLAAAVAASASTASGDGDGGGADAAVSDPLGALSGR